MCEQISLLPDLDRASDTLKAKLCKTWPNAITNESNVYVCNRRDFLAKSKNGKASVKILCALDYPVIHFSFEIQNSTDFSGFHPSANGENVFDVHDDALDAEAIVESALRTYIGKTKIPEALIKEALADMKLSITDKVDEGGWYICPECGEKYAGLVSGGICWECDYLKKHPNAKKQLCSDCVWFRYHATYDSNDFSECSCRKHLTAKDKDDYCYECKDYKKADTAKELDTKYKQLAVYIANKPTQNCKDCGKEYRSLLKEGICLPCYEKRLKKADEIIRGFIAEGWEEVAPEDYKSANSETNGWIDERNMDPLEPRKGKRFFTIDKVNLKWRCFFKREGQQQ